MQLFDFYPYHVYSQQSKFHSIYSIENLIFFYIFFKQKINKRLRALLARDYKVTIKDIFFLQINISKYICIIDIV